jgi:ABC-type transport system involved in multi-copper enzyme maturation permease subunit
MRSPTKTAFAAVFQNELLLSSKRVAPYALMLFFSSNAVLWSVAGAAVNQGWATNSDYYIGRNFAGFAFGVLGLPLFTAVIMADPVIRDFRLGIDPLIFSKPVSRAAYLLGKFVGSFFVLVCCQAAFMLTLILLQVVHTSRMIVLPFRLFPYFKHFFVLLVASYLLFAAVYFTVGTLTRNARIVYGLAFSYYPIYIAWQVLVLKNLPDRWRTLLDPVLMRPAMDSPWGRDPAWVDQQVLKYTSVMIANRVLVILSAAVCLAFLYFRFSISERTRNQGSFSLLELSTAAERIHYDSETFESAPVEHFAKHDARRKVALADALPEVARTNEGLRANWRKLWAATSLELRLLRMEKSLVVIIPLALLVSFLSLPFSAGVSSVSHSASFASHTANGVLLFLLGVIVFYTGEAMHRDREVRVEPVLWSVPAPNSVLLLSKFLSTLLLTIFLLVLIGLTAMLTQLLRGQTPLEISPYLITYTVIVVPSLVFVAGVSVALNVLLRDKYFAYAVSIVTGAGLLYLYTQGYNHWLYNPVLYGLWTPADFAGVGSGFSRILGLRIYCLSIALICLFVAHLSFERKSN